MRRRATTTVDTDSSETPAPTAVLAPAVAVDEAADAAPLDPAPVDADAAAQPAMVEQVAAAVVETVLAATIQPTLPARRRRTKPTAASTPAAPSNTPAPESGAAPALALEAGHVHDETPAIADLSELTADALAVTVVDERRSIDGDVAVIMQSADASTATTPIALPTSPITLPVTRRSRRRAIAPATPAAGEERETPVLAATPIASADEPVRAAVDSARDADETVEDEFEAAARLFAFTGETPIQVAAQALAEPERRITEGLPFDGIRRRSAARRVAAASFSVGVMGVVGLLTVGMTMPVSALASASGTESVADVAAVAPATTTLAAGDVAGGSGIQAYVAPAEAHIDAVERSDGYTASSYREMAAESGITNFSNFYVNDPTAAIQWPFAVGVPITYGFGMRDGRMHEGADFVPGEGSPIQAIADGTVRIATESGGAFGVTVLIDHEIDGQLVSSRYGHMLYGSLQVSPGEKVTVGQFLGRTGNTGRSFGAHTHFEILQNGTTPVDPIEWLRSHAGG